ncbi:MAG: GDP-L-fucose synthase [Desulfatitalea sp.]
MEIDKSIYIAGHTGMVGSALRRKLKESGYEHIITRTHQELDLLDQAAVADFFESQRPDYVFLAAGKTGGIYANNTYRADFIYENIVIQSNIIQQSFLNEVQKLMFYACSCMYPKACSQPMAEEHLLTGPLEPTNEPFALAKIVGLKMCESFNRQYGTDFITLIPTNVYGPNQRYEPMNSLVVPSLLQKFHKAKIQEEDGVVIWGSGRPVRDLLYVDDLADASLYLMTHCEGNVVLNVGTGREVSVAELAEIVKQEVGYEGDIIYDASLPDGVERKLQDLSKLTSLGWSFRVELAEGIHLAYQDFLQRIERGERLLF